MIIAQVFNGRIVNAIEADSVQWAIDNLDGDWVAMPEGAGIGWNWDGTTATPPPVTPPRMRLTKLEFRRRFTFAEKQAIYAAAEVSADIRIFLDDIQAAEYIELDNADTIAGVGALETAGLIAAGRADEILAGVTD